MASNDPMTPEERRQAEVLVIAAKLSDAMATHAVSQAELGRRMSANRATVNRMLQGSDAYLSTWLDAFDALGYRVVLVDKDVV